MARILGVSCYFHDAAACLYVDGRLIAAAEEERFSRVKHDARFPFHAIDFCLREGGLEPGDLDYVVFHEKPLIKLERILATCIDGAPASLGFFVAAMQAWLSEKLWVPSTIRGRLGRSQRVLYAEHHMSHAASAYYLSPFDECAVLTVDGVGEWTTTAVGLAQGSRLTLLKEIRFPHSLGLLYSVMTAYLGFEVNEGEYKVMGMAAHGTPRYANEIRRILRVGPDGSYRLDLRAFRYQRSRALWDAELVEMLGPSRAPAGEIDQRHMDIAASLQRVTEDTIVGLAEEAHRLAGSRRLAFAGGVALNVLANREILRRTPFEQLFVPPAPGDSGASVGAAAYVSHAILGEGRELRPSAALLGPSYEASEIRAFLDKHGIPYSTHPDHRETLERIAGLVVGGKIIGWFCGRMEFGPRALGARSILADPTDPSAKELLNTKVKHRETFRPFGPAVTDETAAALFTEADPSPYMLLTTQVRPEQRTRIPAVVHADGSVRYQTVSRESQPLFHELIERIGRRTGVAAVLNTSFNVAGEPIVCSPEDAFRCFCSTGIDALVLWPYLLGPEAKRAMTPTTRRSDGEVWLT